MRKLGGLYTPRYIPYGFHMEWVDSNPIPWTAYGLFFGWQPSHFFIPYPPWSPWNGPFHGHSMFQSMWIPWNFQWIYTENLCTIPYGFHGRIHIKFRGRTINCIVKNSVTNKNWTLNFMTRHVRKQGSALTVEPCKCYRTIHYPPLIVLWVGHAQSERRQTPMLDLGAINNPQRSFTTTT